MGYRDVLTADIIVDVDSMWSNYVVLVMKSMQLCVLSELCVCEGRTAMHRAVEAHGQPADASATEPTATVNDSTPIIRLLAQHGAEINQPVCHRCLARITAGEGGRPT